MKNIFFIGFMGTGKTTISKLVSEKLGMKWVDLDEIITKRENKNIVNIFKENGEQYFRELEREVLREIADEGGYVVSTGGGIVIVNENMEIMKKNGIVVTLAASPEVIFERVKDDQDRPLLQVSNPMEEIKRLMFERAHFYIKGDIIIDTSYGSPEELAEEIIAGIGSV
ncbi:MAG: shikimate kinase [Calditerrivibrio sp.]|nr:shikimate kinase [Calditerrivibrio sp.]MCA1933635.1 shikimate kinase [Calditerrivibrio sp.]MCA1980724.1 shikimate kinase [Calditerrivibrio sp.]